jgi:Uma2 family endonuclease
MAHQVVVSELHLQIRSALKKSPIRMFVAPLDVRLPKGSDTDDQIDTVVQPDLLIVSDPRKLDARGVRGAPDWVAEVLSPSTASYDQTVKLAAYERAGVREVWLVHPIDLTLTIYRLEGDCYGRAKVQELKGRTALTAVGDVTVDWDEVLAGMP